MSPSASNVDLEQPHRPAINWILWSCEGDREVD